MGRNYSQLDLDERIELNCLRDAGCSRREIGRLMGRMAAVFATLFTRPQSNRNGLLKTENPVAKTRGKNLR